MLPSVAGKTTKSVTTMRQFGKRLFSTLGFIAAFGLFGSAFADSRTDLAHLHSGQSIHPPGAALRWVMQIAEHCAYGQSYEQYFRAA